MVGEEVFHSTSLGPAVAATMRSLADRDDLTVAG